MHFLNSLNFKFFDFFCFFVLGIRDQRKASHLSAPLRRRTCAVFVFNFLGVNLTRLFREGRAEEELREAKKNRSFFKIGNKMEKPFEGTASERQGGRRGQKRGG